MKSEEGYKVVQTFQKSTKSIARIFIPQLLNLQGCKLVCLVGNPNEHSDKSYHTGRCPEVDHVEYSNRQSIINFIDAVQSLQSLMVKNYHLTICRISLVIKHHET